MAEWKPGDLCQVRRGKRWVDAEIDSVEHCGRPGNVRVVMDDGSRVRADAGNLRPRPSPRWKLPEPKAEEYRPTVAGRVAAIIAAAELGAMGEESGPVLVGGFAGHAPGQVTTVEVSKVDHVRREITVRPVPKPTTARSEAYLAHVRRHPCCSCGTTEAIHAHHVASGGMGQKASDYLAAPLCGRCHQHWHGRADLPSRDGGKWPESGAQSRAILWEAAARCLESWVVKKVER